MSDWMIYLALFLGTFALMEGVAWAMHKYVMHGFLWCLHKSHHEPRTGRFELNDLFGVFFAVVSMVLIYIGVWHQLDYLFVGLGVTAYGAVYFLAHDILVHRRLAIRINPRKGYLRRLYQAHRMHHAVEGKQGCVSFGFVIPPSPGHLKDELKRLAPLRQHQSSRVDMNRRGAVRH
jgi:beta-carotene 3-hydroxylase